MSDPLPVPREAPVRVLAIDDEAVVCVSIAKILGPEGFEVETRTDAEDGLRAALSGAYDLVLLDMRMPRLDGLEVLRRIREAGVAVEVLIVTGHSSVDSVVGAMRGGAADYVAKPFTPDELVGAVRRAVEHSPRLRDRAELRRGIVAARGFEGILGASRAMEEVFAALRRVASTDCTVLITGESGTGKELVARALHRLGARREKPFLPCDCSALAPTLLESELFGHVKGSFSGAVSAKQGLFEVAHGGTLFLDEVANISLETQSKLLRVLETRSVRRVGDTDERAFDVRLVAATNRDLAELAARKEFREDLFYRLNVVPLRLPALRERVGDVRLLAEAFLERHRARGATTAQGFAPEALDLLGAHSWPGNVRELRNIVERMAVLCDAERIEPRHVPTELRSSPCAADPLLRLPERWDEFKELKRRAGAAVVDDLERRFLQAALERASGNVTRAADGVGMQRTQFHALLRKHGLGPTVE
jgi:DNA-binding NtrC family response regulator